MNIQAQQAQLVKISIITQIIQRAIVSLAVMGIWAAMGHTIYPMLVLATYAVVSVIHGFYIIYQAGGFHTPIMVGTNITPKKVREPVGFQMDRRVSSSADAVRKNQTV